MSSISNLKMNSSGNVSKSFTRLMIDIPLRTDNDVVDAQSLMNYGERKGVKDLNQFRQDQTPVCTVQWVHAQFWMKCNGSFLSSSKLALGLLANVRNI